MKKHIVESHEKYLDYNVLMHVKLSTEDFSESRGNHTITKMFRRCNFSGKGSR